MAGAKIVADEISRLKSKRSELVKQRDLLCDKFEEVYPVPDKVFREVLDQVERNGFEMHCLEIEIQRLEELNA